jgi:hypothetical protein
MTTRALAGPTAAANAFPYPTVAGAVALRPAFGDILDLEDGGAFKVLGTTKNKNLPSDLPVSRLVRLHDAVSGRVVRAQWSEAGTGNYAFERIRAGVFYVASFDHTGEFNGVIATGVASEAM